MTLRSPIIVSEGARVKAFHDWLRAVLASIFILFFCVIITATGYMGSVLVNQITVAVIFPAEYVGDQQAQIDSDKTISSAA